MLVGVVAVPSTDNLAPTRGLYGPAAHAGIMQHVSQIVGRQDYLPCCSPTAFSNLSVLYQRGPDEVLYDVVPVMVDSCGCT